MCFVPHSFGMGDQDNMKLNQLQFDIQKNGEALIFNFDEA